MFLKRSKQKIQIVKKSEVAKQYNAWPSLPDRLSWLEWSDSTCTMLLEDGHSVGAAFEIRDIPTEAQPESVIESLHQRITSVLSSMVPLHDQDPWVMEFFLQDDLTLEPLYERLKKYIDEKGDVEDPLSKHYLQIMRDHFKLMCRDEGLFIDPMNGLPFQGRIRRIRMNLYRRYSEGAKPATNVVDELNTVIENVENRLRGAQISIRRLSGRHLYEWWVRWFNPKPSITGGDQDKLLEKFPYPGTDKPFGWSFDQNIFFGEVHSDEESRCWRFDGIPHKVMVFKDLQQTVDIGVISRERKSGFGANASKSALFDELPPGTIYTMKIIFQGKNAVLKHLSQIDKGSVGGNEATTQEITTNIARAKYEMDNGNMLFRTIEAIYLKGKTVQELKQHEALVQARLEDAGLLLVRSEQEVYPLDNYLRFLPFNFNYHFDKQNTYRSTYKYADDVARLLPIYGRTRGDGQFPLFTYFNRGGEPFIFDHLNKQFKMSNSHMAIVGTTGAGKSVALNNLILSLSAVYNPRIIALEVGDSFGLMAKYLKSHGRDVLSMKFQRQSPIPVNPYAEAYVALQMVEKEEAIISQNALKEQGDQASANDRLSEDHADKVHDLIDNRCDLASEDELECSEDRDILNEMILATRTMITGGVEAEEARMTRADTMLISKAIIHCMKRCRDLGAEQMLVQHLAQSFMILSASESNSVIAARFKEFALNLDEYQHGLKGQFINKHSEPLGDHDFMQIDFGFMQDANQYQDMMNVVCISLLAKILALAEANKASGRPTILIIDEIHIFLKSPMVAAFIILMTKVARKLGLWLIPCTQNINDFRGVESRKILSMMETWLCLALDREEVKLIEEFKPLSDEIKSLILDIEKHQGIYSEGVLLGKRYTGLFRNIPPRIVLSLAMTEQDERTKRKQLMEELNLSELEAVEYMAKKMETAQIMQSVDRDFF